MISDVASGFGNFYQIFPQSGSQDPTPIPVTEGYSFSGDGGQFSSVFPTTVLPYSENRVEFSNVSFGRTITTNLDQYIGTGTRFSFMQYNDFIGNLPTRLQYELHALFKVGVGETITYFYNLPVCESLSQPAW